MAFDPITSCQINGGAMKTVRDFIFLGSKSLRMVTAAMKLKRLALWEKSYGKHRQQIKKQRYRFANKGPYSQSRLLVFPVVMYG